MPAQIVGNKPEIARQRAVGLPLEGNDALRLSVNEQDLAPGRIAPFANRKGYAVRGGHPLQDRRRCRPAHCVVPETLTNFCRLRIGFGIG